MREIRQRIWQRLGALLGVALVLALLGTAGHHHGTASHDASDRCATCVASQHAPAVAAAPPPLPAPATFVVAVASPAPRRAPRLHQAAARGRAPPRTVPTSTLA